ncbi:MAG: hypothetical protein JO320_21880, partial [Alphaproteobacteria bacterium]|nr:hypothetical protein [Alphaproteobacteria bacterium]
MRWTLLMSAHAKTLRLILGVTLYALPGWAGDSSYITGKIQQFHQQSENCSDQGQPEDCITARNMRNLMPLIAGYVTPMAYGCVGDGVADDTRCLQNAIDAAQMAGLPLRFDTAHLFNITHTLTISAPIYIEGQYRYGIWVVNQSTGKGPEACPWGLVTRNTDIDMIRASAVTGTIRGLCIDMTGNQSINPTAGAAINLTPPDSLHYSSGWHIEQNTILQPFDGIAAYGTGPGKLCCGVGTTADGDAILRNTIVSPAGSAISIGKDHVNNAAGPGTVGITVSDNDIVCKTKISKSQGIGVALYEGAIWYDGTQNGPEGCHIGTLVAPGVISGQQQAAQFDGDGVLGDQSGLYDFLVRPEGGLI